MKYALRWHFELTSAASDADLADHVDCVMQELIKLEDCMPEVGDSAIGLDADHGKAEIELTITVDDLEDALRVGKAAIRAAVHAAGGQTPGWDDESGGSVEYDLIDVSLEPLAAVPA